MGYISLENLVQNMSAEQRIFTSWFYSQFDNNSAANKKIINVELLNFAGAFAGTEFLTYAANKLYIALYIKFFGANFDLAAPPYITYYDFANVIFVHNANSSTYWNGANPKYMCLPTDDKNIYFSRIEVVGFNPGVFKGYRITLI